MKIWIESARPKTLGAALSPVIIGSAMAWHSHEMSWYVLILLVICATLIQIGTNYANDYFDGQKGTDTKERLGPIRPIHRGDVTPDKMKIAFILTFGLAFIIGLALVYRGGLPILILGFLSILFGILYTAGPSPLSHNGSADIFVLLFFGPLATGGTFYLHSGTIGPEPLIAGFAPGFLSTALLTINNLRDQETDRNAGRKTLAVRFGPKFARMEYYLMLILTVFIPIYLSFSTGTWPVLLAAVTIPLLLRPVNSVIMRESPGAELNKALGQTGKMLILYSIVFSVTWILT